jgi:hypothetical protein
MSIFASRTVKTIPIPFDPPHEVTIQKLAGRHLAKAKNAFLASLFDGVRDRGGAAVQKEMQALFGNDDKAKKAEAEAEVEKVKADPLNGYDKHTLISCGVKSWTYEAPIDEGAINDLDEEAVDFFAREIMLLTKPSLFQTAQDAEDAQKNG